MNFLVVVFAMVAVACLPGTLAAVIYDGEYGDWLVDRQSMGGGSMGGSMGGSTGGGSSIGGTLGSVLGGVAGALPVVGPGLQGPVSSLVQGASSGLLGALTNGAYTRYFLL